MDIGNDGSAHRPDDMPFALKPYNENPCPAGCRKLMYELFRVFPQASVAQPALAPAPLP
jgi:hypothetical protein